MTTIGINPDCPGGIHLLADHLDTALAVGEDLLALVLPPRADLDEADPETAPEAIDQFVRRLRELEAALLMRVLQARRRAVEIGRADASLRSAASLFRAQTAALVDLIETADRRDPSGLGGGQDGLAYLRSRALLAPEAAAPSPYESLVVTEDLRIGGVAPLGLLLDLVSSLLDLLDAHFGLYAVLTDDAAAEAVIDVTASATTRPDSDRASAAATATCCTSDEDSPDGREAEAGLDAAVVMADLASGIAVDPTAGGSPGAGASEIEQLV